MRVEWSWWSIVKLTFCSVFGRGAPAGWVSEEEVHLLELEELDRTNPGWDADFRIQHAASMLRSGNLSLADARILYEDDEIAEALRRNEETEASSAKEREACGQK